MEIDDTPPPFADVAEAVRPPSPYTRPSTTGGPTTSSPRSALDGVCDIPGMGTHESHDALREALRGLDPRRPQRHLVLNTLDHLEQRRGRGGERMRSSSREGEGPGSIQLVGRYQDTLHRDGGTWRSTVGWPRSRTLGIPAV